MKTIELTEEAYRDLLELKNHLTVKLHEIVNPQGEDLEPDYTFSQLIVEITAMIKHEQETGEVAYIT